MQHLRVERDDTAFTSHYQKHQVIKVAIAHGEGNYTPMPRRSRGLKAKAASPSAIAMHRARVGGAANPNGSVHDIAGIYSEKFNVLGLMPHPENLIDPLVGGTDGRAMFESLAAA